MPITNYIPSSRLIQPGVCTSTTRPAAPFDGQVIYETNTKQTLVWQGSAWVMLTDAETPPGMELVRVQAIGTGVATATVTNCFSADYDNYRIVLNGGTVSSPGSIFFQLNNSTGATYSHFGYYGNYGTATLVAYAPGNGTSWTDAIIGGTAGYSAFIDLANPFISGRPTTGKTHTLSTATAYDFYLRDTNTNSNTGFSIGPIAGGVTMTGGTIRVYGYRNSI